MRRLVPLAALAATGCFFGPDNTPPAQLTGLPRALTADEAAVSTAANHFAFTLFKRLNAEESATKNVFVSPLSVSFSLGMTLNGAAPGPTLDEMRQALGFGTQELAAINAGYKGLMGLEQGLDPSTTFQVANSVWHRQTLPVHSTFTQVLQQVFNADVRSSPFDATTITQVNDWVKQKTANRIPTILDAIEAEDVMFLINAIYFKGSWRDQFDPGKTQLRAFQAIDGAQQVPTMRRDDGVGKLRYKQTPSAVVGELSYGNGAFVMTIVVPASDVGAFVASLDTASWRGLLDGMSDADYAVQLPRFQLEYKRELSADLKALGMQTPFKDGIADFSGMSAMGKQLFIAFVQHKTFVLVDEVGTEAAAVTNTGMQLVSLPPCLCVDRPFIFAIRERFSGTILFIGRIVRIPG